MLPLPDPVKEPDAFLLALASHPDAAASARAAGCSVHPLTAPADHDPAALAQLHAAGARALAASLARGAAPMLLIFKAPDSLPAPRYAPALAEGLMGYERIHTTISPAVTLILILPPSQTNAYWQR